MTAAINVGLNNKLEIRLLGFSTILKCQGNVPPSIKLGSPSSGLRPPSPGGRRDPSDP